MDIKTFAEHMWPFWILGVMVMRMVIAAGQKQLLRLEKKPMLKWIGFLAGITLFRFFMAKLSGFNGGAHGPLPPWPLAFTVFWEDLCHGLPLVILRRLIGNTKWWTRVINFIALIAVMAEFGYGHTYQGILPAFLLSFYIPYSVSKGEQYGFGTIMIGHMLYDLVTLLFVKYMFGL